MKTAVVFPGQGTQKPGMGQPWVSDPAWAVVERAEAALGEPLAPLLLDATAEDLGRTRAAQLAVLLTSLVVWDATAPLVDGPVAFAGHSLGQVTALIASGVLGFDDGIRFAARRAELTQLAADSHPGRMAALLGATLEQAEDACTAAADGCWVANDNAPGQVVLAGTADGLEAGIERARELGVRKAMPLSVGGAFHTPLMQSAAESLAAELEHVELHVPSAPVVSNGDGLAYTDADGWRERSAAHVAAPVRWRLVQATLGEMAPPTIIEVGHGTMLASLAKRTLPEIPVHGVATPAAVAELADA